MHKRFIQLAVGGLSLFPLLCQAAEMHGASLSIWWAVPFAGLLLSIAIWPLVAAHFWHHHFGKITLAWALAFLLPCAAVFGIDRAVHDAVHALVAEYIPFIVLLTALFTVAGGICVRGNLKGTPAVNTGLLAIGTALASLMGTTGAAMLMIRPLIRANAQRQHVVHVVVFFIFLAANVGGSLTPLGDPPLFLGFLQGIDFFWTMKHIFPETLFLCVALLMIFYALDWHYCHRREETSALDPRAAEPIRIEGKRNFFLLAAVIGLVLMSGLWKPQISFGVLGTEVELQNAVRDVLLLVIVLVSLRITPPAAHEGNHFSWEPIKEVAKLFVGIFITITPVITILRAGSEGAFAFVIHAVTDGNGQPANAMYFWATGILSSFLDNAPTYLVFFNTAGGDPDTLMTTLANTLAAISCGAVFMGAVSYIGNAPNMMVKSIAEERGVRMPSFFGYMLWSCAVLGPLFVVMTFVFFR